MKSIALGITLLLSSHLLLSQGKVYLVLGSDTAIWEGMDVARYNCTYALSLYTDPARNAALVMDPAFRLPLQDSYGTPVKLTWWMMAGNIFRHATNTNVPNPNTMTLHLMKKYQGASIATLGDELSLHYHTFVWTDYNGDGIYYWNQALTFPETSDDFDVTLAEMLLEENTFPVSFRSGWHWMDNAWQQRLDTLLQYSMHNDWPAQRTDLTEPLDNTYDWSRAPSTFVPFHPSPTDYQVPGPGRGWNVRSEYMSSADSTFMWGIFARAAAGTDQVVCLWAHLPETDFLDNVRKVNTSAHKVAPLYPGVQFRYCTAVEAMQRWRGTADSVRPHLTFEEISEGSSVRWAIASSEPIFQATPFVTAKNKYGEYLVLPCYATGSQTWETSIALTRVDLAKVGVAATDTSGNLTIEIRRYLPDDIFIDDADPEYTEHSGLWTTSSNASWGTTSRTSTLAASDSAKAVWAATLTQAATYNIFAQIPALSNPAQQVEFRLMQDNQVVGTKSFLSGVPTNKWVYLGTHFTPSQTSLSVQMVAKGTNQPGRQVAADVIKYSALVRDKWLVIEDEFAVGEVIVQQENIRNFPVRNEGILPVVLSSANSIRGVVTVRTPLPVTIPAMGNVPLQFNIESPVVGVLYDTVVIVSDDPRHALVRTPVRGNVVNYFAIVDDRDSLAYSETGAWNFSVASAYGPTSRYAYPASGVSAAFTPNLTRSGVYQISEIVPTTVNASVRARYVLRLNGARVDSALIDQNAGSGAWVQVMERFVPAGTDVRLELTDAMSPPVPGAVLRADAIRFQWVRDSTTNVHDENDIPIEFSISQNYPNPFNPSTRFRISIADLASVSLRVYNVLGQEVAVVLDEKRKPGIYEIQFDASGLASGIYLYRLSTGTFTQTRKMILAR